MAKTGGLGDNYYYSGVDLSGDTNSIAKLATPMVPIDVTDLTQFANSRLGGLRAGQVDWLSYFDPTGSHPSLSALPRADQFATYFRGTAIGNPAWSCQGVQLNYDPTRNTDGGLILAITLQSDGFGGEWGEQLTAGKRTDTAATTGPTQDDNPFLGNGVSTPFGAQGYLQLFSITGTSVDPIIEHSPDNSSWSTLIDFGAQAAAPVALRGTFSGLVQRYVRVRTAGTFSNAQFAVQLCRNVVATSF